MTPSDIALKTLIILPTLFKSTQKAQLTKRVEDFFYREEVVTVLLLFFFLPHSFLFFFFLSLFSLYYKTRIRLAQVT